jgi:hypothetical protein
MIRKLISVNHLKKYVVLCVKVDGMLQASATKIHAVPRNTVKASVV